MKRTNYTFYYLEDPTTGAIGYVGMTTEPLSKRLSRHITEAIREEHSAESDKNKWIRSLYDQGLRPLINQIETGGYPDPVKAGEREKYWIAKYREEGYGLTNMTDGGLGTPGFTFEHSDETKEKIAESMTKYDPDILYDGIKMRLEGQPWKAIYEHFGMSRTNFYKIYKDKIELACK